MPEAREFSATVESGPGGRVFVRLPFDPSQAWGQKARHHITGSVNGVRIRGPLASDGGHHLLLLGQAWRRDSGLGPGDAVRVELIPEGPQQDNMAADVTAALDAAPTAREFFESLASFYRKGYVNWVEDARRPETRARRIVEMMEALNAGKKQR